MVLSPKVRSVVAGVLVANSAPHLATVAVRPPGRWDDRLVAFEAGYLSWALWMTVSKHLLRVNWDR